MLCVSTLHFTCNPCTWSHSSCLHGSHSSIFVNQCLPTPPSPFHALLNYVDNCTEFQSHFTYSLPCQILSIPRYSNVLLLIHLPFINWSEVYSYYSIVMYTDVHGLAKRQCFSRRSLGEMRNTVCTCGARDMKISLN